MTYQNIFNNIDGRTGSKNQISLDVKINTLYYNQFDNEGEFFLTLVCLGRILYRTDTSVLSSGHPFWWVIVSALHIRRFLYHLLPHHLYNRTRQIEYNCFS